MAGESLDLVQRHLLPKTIAKLQKAVQGPANAIDEHAHPRFILTQQSLEALVTMSRTPEARHIHSISFAARLINPNCILPLRNQQDCLDFQTLLRHQEMFIMSGHPLSLIVEAFRNLARHGNAINLLVDDTLAGAGFHAHYGPWGTDRGTL